MLLQASRYPDANLEEPSSPGNLLATPPAAPPAAWFQQLMLHLVARECVSVTPGSERRPQLSHARAASYLSAAGTVRRQAPHTRAFVMF